MGIRNETKAFIVVLPKSICNTTKDTCQISFKTGKLLTFSISNLFIFIFYSDCRTCILVDWLVCIRCTGSRAPVHVLLCTRIQRYNYTPRRPQCRMTRHAWHPMLRPQPSLTGRSATRGRSNKLWRPFACLLTQKAP